MISTLAVVLLCWSQDAAVREGTQTLLCTIEHAAWLPKTLVASPDGRRVAYAVQEPDGFFWVVDGKPQKKFEKIGFLQFSPDSKRFLYSGGARERTLVVDGKEHGPYEVVGYSTFSADGKRVAALASKGGGKWTVLLDDEEKTFGDVQDLAFGPANRLVYQVKDKAGFAAGVDGVTGKTYDQMPPLKGRLLPVVKGETLRYVGLLGKKVFLVEEKVQ